MEEKNPKVLVGVPTYSGMDYCHDKFFDRIRNLSFDKYDVLAVDNSRDDWYFEKLEREVDKFDSGKGKFIVIRDDSDEERNIYRLICSRNKILDYARENGYDYLMMFDSDVIAPLDIIEELLGCKKDIVSGIYFNYFKVQGKMEIHPVAYKCFTEEEFESVKRKVELPPHVKSHLDLKYHLTKEDVDSGELIEVLIASAGCLLLSKDAFSKLRYGLVDTSDSGAKTSDDVYFMLKAKELGLGVYCYTKARCEHLIKDKFRREGKNLVHPVYD